MKQRNKRIIAYLLVLTLSLGVFGCGAPKKRGGPGMESQGSQVVPVETSQVAKGSLQRFTVLSGVTKAAKGITILPKITGLEKVVSIKVKEGDEVAEGQVIALLDQETASIELDNAQIAYDDALQDYEKNKALFQAGAVSEIEHSKYETALKNAENNLAVRKLALDNTVIKSPFKGTVADLGIEEGEMVSSQTKVAEIVNLETIEINTSINEMEVTKISQGDKVNVKIPALNNKIFPGQIAYLSLIMDDNLKGFPLRIELDNPDGEIKGGMYAQIELVTDRREGVLIVPRRAVQFADGESTVFIIKDGKAQKKLVTTGISTGQEIEIIDGLEEGAEIVINGNDRLIDGDQVEVVNRGVSQ